MKRIPQDWCHGLEFALPCRIGLLVDGDSHLSIPFRVLLLWVSNAQENKDQVHSIFNVRTNCEEHSLGLVSWVGIRVALLCRHVKIGLKMSPKNWASR